MSFPTETFETDYIDVYVDDAGLHLERKVILGMVGTDEEIEATVIMTDKNYDAVIDQFVMITADGQKKIDNSPRHESFIFLWDKSLQIAIKYSDCCR